MIREKVQDSLELLCYPLLVLGFILFALLLAPVSLNDEREDKLFEEFEYQR